MACFGPLTAYRPKEGAESGRLVFKKADAHSGIGIKVPCGQCVGCKLERSRQWAMRCLHEKRLHSRSSFVTLTYADEHLPEFGDLCKRDLQLFMKRLRKQEGPGVRFYACGEYGDVNLRPHYHILLFNVDFSDMKFFSQNRRGDKTFTSDCLRELWPFGHNNIGDVNFESCAYVARYVLKKITGKAADEHYMVYDSDGLVHVRPPEFTVMSRRPGIGAAWYEKFGSEVAVHDTVVVNGREVRPPRYYDELLSRIDTVRLDELKVKRRRAALVFRGDQSSRRRRTKEIIQLRRLDIKKRGL